MGNIRFMATSNHKNVFILTKFWRRIKPYCQRWFVMHKESSHSEAGQWFWLDSLVRNLRFACRVTRRQPGSTLAVIGILALAIGVTTAVFSLYNALAYVPLPYRDVERLVTFGYGGVSPNGSTPAIVEEFKQRATDFEDVALYKQADVDLLGAGEPVRVTVGEVTVNFLNVIGATPRLGRLFYPEDEIGGSGGVIRFDESGRVYSEKEKESLDLICPALISERLWRSRFSESPDAIGKLIALNGRTVTIIGVLPTSFDYPTGSQIWTPTFHFSNYFRESGTPSTSGVIARIRPSVPFERAARQYHDILYRAFSERENFAPIVDRVVSESYVQIIGGVPVQHPFGIQPLRTTLSYGGRAAWLLLVAALMVMLIAVINVAGLVMARILFRQQEFAIRFAVGATRRSLFGMLLVEHTLLAVAGGAAGFLVAAVGIQGLKPLLPPDWPAHAAAVGIDWRVLLFTLGIAAVVGLFTGIAAAFFLFQMRRAAGTEIPGERAGVPRRLVLWRSALIFVETALALALLFGSGVFLKDYIRRLNIDPGFNTENLLTLSVARVADNTESRAQNSVVYADVMERLRAIPGARFVSGATNLDWAPRSGSRRRQFTTEDGDGNKRSTLAADHNIASDYFAAMGYRIAAGRDFEDRERMSNERVAIINTAMAQALQIDSLAAGNSVSYGIAYSLIGLVDSGDEPQFYLPGLSSGTVYFIIRASDKSQAFVQAARNAVFAADNSQTIVDMDWVENMLAWRLREPRSLAALVSVFAFLGYALVLAGVYGVITHATKSRLREYGIRLSFGARPLRLWLRASAANLPPLLAGIAAGTWLSWYAGKIISGKVQGIDAAILDFRGNLETLAVISLALLLTALATGAFASRDILRVEPNVLLRNE